jgi:hypothetical protein
MTKQIRMTNDERWSRFHGSRGNGGFGRSAARDLNAWLLF